MSFHLLYTSFGNGTQNDLQNDTKMGFTGFSVRMNGISMINIKS